MRYAPAMSLEDRLGRWHKAGLITREQADRIAQFERARGKPLLVYAVAGLGGLSIAIGIVAVVAANWDDIPPSVKLVANLFWLAVVGASAVRFVKRGPGWAREAALIVYFGLVLGSIALVAQVYQLGGEPREAMAIWIALTAPILAFGRSGWLGLLWLISVQATCATWLAWFADGPEWRGGYALAGVYVIPLAYLLLGRSAWLRRARPAYALVFENTAWLELVVAGSAGTFALYEDFADERWYGLGLGLLVSTGLCTWAARGLRTSAGGRGALGVLVATLLLFHFPFALSPGDLDLLGALSFIALWLLVAFAAHRGGKMRVLNFATAVVGVRILAVYFELFGSLLSTGLGLITGGALTLGLVWLWMRKRRDFERELGASSQTSSRGPA